MYNIIIYISNKNSTYLFMATGYNALHSQPLISFAVFDKSRYYNIIIMVTIIIMINNHNAPNVSPLTMRDVCGIYNNYYYYYLRTYN